MNYIVKIPNKYKTDEDYTEEGKIIINSTLIKYFTDNHLIFPLYYFHHGWNPKWSFMYGDKKYSGLADYCDINEILWTESIISPKHHFHHNFIRSNDDEDIQIFKILKSYAENNTYFKMWDYSNILIKDKSWIPDISNLIDPTNDIHITDKKCVYSRKNALLFESDESNGIDCSVFFKDAFRLSGMTHYGTVHKIHLDIDEIIIEPKITDISNKYLKYKRKYLRLKKNIS